MINKTLYDAITNKNIDNLKVFEFNISATKIEFFHKLVFSILSKNDINTIDWLILHIEEPSLNAILINALIDKKHYNKVDVALLKNTNFKIFNYVIYQTLFTENHKHSRKINIIKKIINHHDFKYNDEVFINHYDISLSLIVKCIKQNNTDFSNIAFKLIKKYHTNFNISYLFKTIILSQNKDLILKIKKHNVFEMDLSQREGYLFTLFDHNLDSDFIDFVLINTNINPLMENNIFIVDLLDNKRLDTLALFKNNKKVKDCIRKLDRDVHNFLFIADKIKDF